MGKLSVRDDIGTQRILRKSRSMVNTVYPGTTQQPMQQIDFFLSGDVRVRANLSMRPSKTGQVEDVLVEATMAGSDVLNAILSSENLSVFQAGTLAYRYAQSEAQRLGVQFDRIELQGQEFLEVADVEALTGNVAPVIAV